MKQAANIKLMAAFNEPENKKGCRLIKNDSLIILFSVILMTVTMKI